MASINIVLQEPLKLFVEDQATRGGYGSISEYLAELIREAYRRRERDDLEAKLMDGLRSPTSKMTQGDWKALREDILAQSPEAQGGQ